MLQEQAKEHRHERIVELLAQPKTAKELSELLGVSYHTARNDLAELARKDLVQTATQRSEHGKMMFISGGRRPMPVFVMGRGKSTAQEFALNIGKDPEKALAFMHHTVDTIYQILMILLHASTSDVPMEKKQNNQYRMTLTEARTYISKAVVIADQMLAHPAFWDPEKLLTLKQDKEFKPQELAEAYLAYNAYIKEKRGES